MFLDPFRLAAAKTAFWYNLSGEGITGEIFEEGMLIRTLPTTLLQIFCKIILYFQVIVKSITEEDYRVTLAYMG